jgi:hypothetical protein
MPLRADRQNLLAVAIATVVSITLLVVLGSRVGAVNWVEVLVLITAAAVYGTVAVIVDKSRLVAFGWAAGFALWPVTVAPAFGGGSLLEAGRNFPWYFVAWSQVAVVLAAVTEVFLCLRDEDQFMQWRPRACVYASWLVVLFGAAFLAPIATDVGGSILQSDPLVWFVIPVVGLMPFWLAGWFAFKAWRFGNASGRRASWTNENALV